ncbi:MAG: hypothetical protein VYC34_02695, partial [Planctomycetota bacterium]|nr:hypothetical protein [Planctomycetota bacterium]
KSIGDDVDAVTLCLNAPIRIVTGDGAFATSDRIGRMEDGTRWAGTGQIFGDAQQAVYMAMSALFLQPSNVWMFDGYKNEPGFDQYDVGAAAELLTNAQIANTAIDAPHASAEDWRRIASRPLDAGLIHVNTSGMRWHFDLNQGRAYAMDVPALRVPAIVHFVHSFSAQRVSDRNSIARRWLDRGAYAYVGAVDEPYLQAFLPPRTFIGRLASPGALGLAARHDEGRLWKVAIIGDPLLTLGPLMPRPAGETGLEGADDLESRMKSALEERKYFDALRDLIMLGRDADATRLAQSILEDDAQAWNVALSRLVVATLHRTGQRDLFVRVFRTLPPEETQDPALRDLAWLALRPELESGSPSRDVIDTLRAHVRSMCISEDGAALAGAIRRLDGADAAASFLGNLMQMTDNKWHLDRMQRELTRISR